MKPHTRYGILDNFGEVLCWQWSKPSKYYKYITVRVNVEPVIDWSDFEPAPY